MFLRRKARLLCGAVLFLLTFHLSELAAAPLPPAKVDRRVWQDTENGGSAHFLILLEDQSDTKAVGKKHADRKTKRRSVTAALRETASRSQSDLLQLLRRGNAKHRPYWIINMIAAEGNRGLVEALSKRPDVRAIESDRSFRVPLEPADGASLLAGPAATASVTPNLVKIKATNLWALGFTGQGIVYANADTGVQWDHPALKWHYRGWDGAAANHNYNWWDAIHADIDGNGTNPIGFNSPTPADDDGHGTHTTGIGVGDDATANQIGVAPGAKFICCRNMDQGTGTPSTYIECMQFFLAPTDLNGNNPDPDRGADVVGNSYTCPPDELCAPNSLHLMLENTRAAGIFMACAAGNSGSLGCSSISEPPALDDAAITVGATDNNDNIASFSSRGPVLIDASLRVKPDLVAPGFSVVSAIPGNLYVSKSGTSLSTPHVAGAVALLWSAFPHIRGNVDYTESLLKQTALHLTNLTCGGSGVPNNVFGYGRIDVLAAYNAVNGAPIASNLMVSIQGDATASLTLSGSDPEGAALTFQIVQPPTNGLISSFDSGNGTFNYTPAHAFTGIDSLIFNASDGTFSSSNALVQINILAPLDTDHDTIPDYWEMSHSLSETNAGDATLDSDNDGAKNFQEYAANTDPHSTNSVFQVTSITRDNNGHVVLLWNSTGGTRYRVQWMDCSGTQSWKFLDLVRTVTEEMDPHPIGEAAMMRFMDDFSRTGIPSDGSTCFYRVRVVR